MSSSSILIILDKSGSMQSMGDAPITSINEFIEEQKKTDDNALLTMYTFSTNFQRVYDNVPLSQVPQFTDFEPDGTTSLYDTIQEAIMNKLNGPHSRDVVCVILTDGMDNTSQNCDLRAAAQLIARVQAESNWHFIYLGANQDSFTSAQRLSISNSLDFAATPTGMRQAMRTASRSVTQIRRCSASCTGQSGDLS